MWAWELQQPNWKLAQEHGTGMQGKREREKEELKAEEGQTDRIQTPDFNTYFMK